MKRNTIIFMSIYLLLALSVAIAINKREPEYNKSIVYTVKCVDDILEGEFVKINDKYFRHGAIEPTWIPLAQCSLEPK